MENNQRSSSNPHLAKPVLCDGFLIPMTDFVNNVGNMENYPSHEKALSWIYNYANFLKQPLKLEMFVPCDNEGNVLEEPDFFSGDYDDNGFGDVDKFKYKNDIQEYNQAKEKILFELNFPAVVETINYHISRNRNIEYLANFGNIKLTQNSLNAIFGKTVA